MILAKGIQVFGEISQNWVSGDAAPILGGGVENNSTQQGMRVIHFCPASACVQRVWAAPRSFHSQTDWSLLLWAYNDRATPCSQNNHHESSWCPLSWETERMQERETTIQEIKEEKFPEFKHWNDSHFQQMSPDPYQRETEYTNRQRADALWKQNSDNQPQKLNKVFGNWPQMSRTGWITASIPNARPCFQLSVHNQRKYVPQKR